MQLVSNDPKRCSTIDDPDGRIEVAIASNDCKQYSKDVQKWTKLRLSLALPLRSVPRINEPATPSFSESNLSPCLFLLVLDKLMRGVSIGRAYVEFNDTRVNIETRSISRKMVTFHES